jgi:hypothetical protein
LLQRPLIDELFAISDFEGLTGTLSCDDFGDCADPLIDIVRNTAEQDTIDQVRANVLFTFEPETLQYDPTTQGLLEPDQPLVLDPVDPLVYQSFVHWPEPLPVDALIKLNEIQAKMALGLESKRGALADLGTEFPDEKIQEIFKELVEDAKEQGALDMLNAQIQSVILATTGIQMGDGESDTSGPGATQPAPVLDGGILGDFGQEEMNKLLTEIVTQAYGTQIPQRRNPDND